MTAKSICNHVDWCISASPLEPESVGRLTQFSTLFGLNLEPRTSERIENGVRSKFGIPASLYSEVIFALVANAGALRRQVEMLVYSCILEQMHVALQSFLQIGSMTITAEFLRLPFVATAVTGSWQGGSSEWEPSVDREASGQHDPQGPSLAVTETEPEFSKLKKGRTWKKDRQKREVYIGKFSTFEHAWQCLMGRKPWIE